MPEIMLICNKCDKVLEGDFKAVTKIRRTTLHSQSEDGETISETCAAEDVTVAMIRIVPCKRCS